MRIMLTVLFWIALIASPAPAHAGPASIEGSWSGSGIVHYQGGSDPVRCRVSYAASTGRTYLVSATCASTAGTFRQDGRIVHVGGSRYTGRMYSDQYRVSGNVSITLSGSRQSVSVTGPQGSARLTLTRR